MSTIAYKTRDGLYCIAPAPFDSKAHIYASNKIRRLMYPAIRAGGVSPSWSDISPEDLCDVLTREYQATGEKFQGFPVYEEV